MKANPSKPVLYIITNNHFDQTWRRCWERSFDHRGLRYISYADLEEYYLLDNLEIAAQHSQYKFEVECAIVLQKFLERHPERLEELRGLADQGRFAVTGGGEAIIDGNMVLGESLVRNYVDGLLWVEEHIGQKSRLAVRNDAFGNPAQLPQILRGCEIDWATGMSYTPAAGLYWRGLDGSTILHRTLPLAALGGGNTKYPPCATCGGSGIALQAVCTTCAGRGIDDSIRAWLPNEINPEALGPDTLELFNAGLVKMTPEELLPNPAMTAWADQITAGGVYDVRFALEEEMQVYLKPWLDQVDAPPPDSLHPSPELNPNNSGCLVTRIKTKQVVRRQEYNLLAAETLAVMASLGGKPYPEAALKDIRSRQFFTMFHDAITATHIDPAYEELQDYWNSIDQAIDAVQSQVLPELVTSEADNLSVINPTGTASTQLVTAACQTQAPVRLVDDQDRPALLVSQTPRPQGGSEVQFLATDLPAYSARPYRVETTAQPVPSAQPKDAGVIENSRFRIEAGPRGIESIFDKRLNAQILASGAYHPGELILEHDEGSPWATLSLDQTRTPLAPFTLLNGVESGPACQRLTFEVDVPREGGFSGKCLRASVSVTLVEGLDRIDFQVNAWWDGFNHRLRVAMPLTFTGSHLYEVPYGIIERQPYQPWFSWAGANGDWPALNWAGVSGELVSVALLNKGTPSYRIEPAQQGQGDVILLSLLRSPAIPTYLHEPEFYTMTDFDGMRDMGDHAFSFAISAYNSPLPESNVVADAEAYNAGFLAVPGRAVLPPMPQVTAGPARITAFKWAESGHALVLRLVEFRGQGGQVDLSLPFAAAAVEKVNLLERRGQPLTQSSGILRLTLRPWEIATLKLHLPSGRMET